MDKINDISDSLDGWEPDISVSMEMCAIQFHLQVFIIINIAEMFSLSRILINIISVVMKLFT